MKTFLHIQWLALPMAALLLFSCSDKTPTPEPTATVSFTYKIFEDKMLLTATEGFDSYHWTTTSTTFPVTFYQGSSPNEAYYYLPYVEPNPRATYMHVQVDATKGGKDAVQIRSVELPTFPEPVMDFRYAMNDASTRFVLRNTSLEDLKTSFEDFGEWMTTSWSTTSDLVTIQDADRPTAYITFPELTEETTIQVTCEIRYRDRIESKTKDVVLPVSGPSEVRKLGLGVVLKEEHSNNRDYDWYYTQTNSGYNSHINSGPACAAMIFKWYNESFSKTTYDVSLMNPSTATWYPWQIAEVINQPHTSGFISFEKVREALQGGSIVLIYMSSTERIRTETNAAFHVHRYYAGDFSHNFIIKGYKIVDDTIWYEVYDPMNGDAIYANGQKKGIDRYYSQDDLQDSHTPGWISNTLIYAPR